MKKIQKKKRRKSKEDKKYSLLAAFVYGPNFISGIFMIAGLYFIYRNSSEIDLKVYYEKQGFIYLMISIILMFYHFFLVFIIGTMLGSKKSIPIKISLPNLENFIDNIKRKLTEEGYESNIFNDNKFDIEYYYKKEKNKNLLTFIIDIEEMTKEVYKSFKNNYFEELGNYLIKQKIINPKQPINLFIYIQVEKKNKEFEDYINTNLLQSTNGLVLATGIIKEDNMIYVLTQKEGPAAIAHKSANKKLVKEIESMKNTE